MRGKRAHLFFVFGFVLIAVVPVDLVDVVVCRTTLVLAVCRSSSSGGAAWVLPRRRANLTPGCWPRSSCFLVWQSRADQCWCLLARGCSGTFGGRCSCLPRVRLYRRNAGSHRLPNTRRCVCRGCKRGGLRRQPGLVPSWPRCWSRYRCDGWYGCAGTFWRLRSGGSRCLVVDLGI